MLTKTCGSSLRQTLVWEATAAQIWNAVFYPDVRLKIHIFISKRYQPAPGQVIPLISLFTSAGQARLKRLTTPAVLRKSCSACSRPFELNYWIWHLIKFSKAYYIQKLNVNSFSISNEENRPRNKEITEFKKITALLASADECAGMPCLIALSRVSPHPAPWTCIIAIVCRPLLWVFMLRLSSVRTEVKKQMFRYLKLLPWGNKRELMECENGVYRLQTKIFVMLHGLAN